MSSHRALGIHVFAGGFTAGVTYYATGVSGPVFSLAAYEGGPALGSTSAGTGTVTVVQQDLSAVEPVFTGPVPPVFPYLPLAGGTASGTVAFTGNPPLSIPASAAAGDVLTSDSSGNASWGPPGTPALVMTADLVRPMIVIFPFQGGWRVVTAIK